jgi:hypothetical protein
VNEAPRPGAPPESGVAEEDSPRRRFRPGCLLWAAGALAVLVGLIVLIGETFDQGADADQPVRTFNAGPAENYPRGDLAFMAAVPVWVVRLEDGEFLALYDRSPKQQETDGPCRITFDETAQLGGAAPVPGIEGAFVEECDGLRTVWRADGVRAFGAGYGDLDRFDVRVDGTGDVIVDFTRRTCTRSRGVTGAPPFDVRRCGKPDDF